MRIDRGTGMLLGLALLTAAPVLAQTTPSPDALPRRTTPDQLRGMTPDQARAQYQSLDPDTKRALRDTAEQAKREYGNDPGMKAQLRSLYKAWKGQ